jgi:hypothetical protein
MILEIYKNKLRIKKLAEYEVEEVVEEQLILKK